MLVQCLSQSAALDPLQHHPKGLNKNTGSWTRPYPRSDLQNGSTQVWGVGSGSKAEPPKKVENENSVLGDGRARVCPEDQNKYFFFSGANWPSLAHAAGIRYRGQGAWPWGSLGTGPTFTTGRARDRGRRGKGTGASAPGDTGAPGLPGAAAGNASRRRLGSRVPGVGGQRGCAARARDLS